MAEPLQIHLAKPGGEKEGPLTLDQVNVDLATGKYSVSDFWAWHEGLPEWVPLYSIQGIQKTSGPTAAAEEAPECKPEPALDERQEHTVFFAASDIPGVEAGAATELDGALFQTASTQRCELFAAASPNGSSPSLSPEKVDPIVEAEEAVQATSLLGARPELGSEKIGNGTLHLPVQDPGEGASSPALSAKSPDASLPEPIEPLPALADTPISVLQAYEAVVRAAMTAAEQEALPSSDEAAPGRDTEPTADVEAPRPSFYDSPETYDSPEIIAHRSGNPVDEQALANLSTKKRATSGVPFSALEHLFVFTTGGCGLLWESPVLAEMLKEIVGEDLATIRQRTPRDVIFNCQLGHLFKRDGSISDAVWRAMSVRSPEVVKRAKIKQSSTFVRSFNLEDDSVILVVLFYNAQQTE